MHLTTTLMDYVPCVTHRLGINKSAKLHKGLQLGGDGGVIDREAENGVREGIDS